MLALGGGEPPQVVRTEALRGDGVEELWAAIAAHRAALEDGGVLAARRGANLAAEVYAVASARARRHLHNAVAEDPELVSLLEQVRQRELDPLTAVHEILRKVFRIDDDNDSDAR